MEPGEESRKEDKLNFLRRRNQDLQQKKVQLESLKAKLRKCVSHLDRYYDSMLTLNEEICGEMVKFDSQIEEVKNIPNIPKSRPPPKALTRQDASALIYSHLMTTQSMKAAEKEKYLLSIDPLFTRASEEYEIMRKFASQFPSFLSLGTI